MYAIKNFELNLEYGSFSFDLILRYLPSLNIKFKFDLYHEKQWYDYFDFEILINDD